MWPPSKSKNIYNKFNQEKIKINQEKTEVDKKIFHAVSFYSEGQPYDKGVDFKYLETKFIQTASKTIFRENINLYTPRILKDLGHSYAVKEYPEISIPVVIENKPVFFLGGGAWKPLICLLELNRIKENEILIYSDSNFYKYPNYENNFNINAIIDIMDYIKFDFLIPRASSPFDKKMVPLTWHTKPNIIKKLTSNSSFIQSFPLLQNSFMVFKKTKVSLKFLQEWDEACKKEEFVDGKIYGDLYKDFKWTTMEQSIGSALVADWVEKGTFNIPKTYPSIVFYERDILKPTKSSLDFSYLNNI